MSATSARGAAKLRDVRFVLGGSSAMRHSTTDPRTGAS
jgi:hypothetical protein